MIQKKYKGISLIEVMTTIALITIMIAVGLTMMGKNKQDSQLEAVSRELAAHLREAQNNALTGKKIDGESTCGFGLHRESASRYSLFYGDISEISTHEDCSRPTVPFDYKSGTFTSLDASFDLPKGITIDEISDIYFSAPFAKVFYNGVGMGGAGTVRYVLTKNKGISGQEHSVYVCVTGNGEVKESKNPC